MQKVAKFFLHMQKSILQTPKNAGKSRIFYVLDLD